MKDISPFSLAYHTVKRCTVCYLCTDNQWDRLSCWYDATIPAGESGRSEQWKASWGTDISPGSYQRCRQNPMNRSPSSSSSSSSLSILMGSTVWTCSTNSTSEVLNQPILCVRKSNDQWIFYSILFYSILFYSKKSRLTTRVPNNVMIKKPGEIKMF